MKRDPAVWQEAERLLKETSLPYKEIGRRIGRTGQAVRNFCRQKNLRELTYLNRPDREMTGDFIQACKDLAATGMIKPAIADRLVCNLRDVFRALLGDEWLNSVFAEPAKRDKPPCLAETIAVSPAAEAWLKPDYLPYHTGDLVRMEHLEGYLAASAIWVEPGKTRPLFAVPVVLRVFLRRRQRKPLRVVGAYRWGTILENASRLTGGDLAASDKALWEYTDKAATIEITAIEQEEDKPP